MSKLHIIAHQQNAEQFQRNLSRLVAKNDNLLFIADSVTCLLDKAVLELLNAHSYTYYALSADCLCRGLEQQLPGFIQPLSDQQMVELCAETSQMISW